MDGSVFILFLGFVLRRVVNLEQQVSPVFLILGQTNLVLLAVVKVCLNHLWNLSVVLQFLNLFSQLRRHCSDFGINID